MSIDQALQAGLDRLGGADARLDVEVLLADALECSRATLHAHREEPLLGERWTQFQSSLDRRARGEPIAYLLGRREFWSLDLRVSPATLIPRPETEHLVELALDLGVDAPGQRVADLGTGCGAVAVALASERPGWQIVATDRCQQALDVARENVTRLGLDNVRLVSGDWFGALPGARFDLVVSNPPYIAEADPHLARGDVRFEPRAALVSGADGLEAIRTITTQSCAQLEAGGALLLEHGRSQGTAVRALLGACGYRDVHTRRDYAGHERVTSARR